MTKRRNKNKINGTWNTNLVHGTIMTKIKNKNQIKAIGNKKLVHRTIMTKKGIKSNQGYREQKFSPRNNHD
jgi:hypothetical protein